MSSMHINDSTAPIWSLASVALSTNAEAYAPKCTQFLVTGSWSEYLIKKSKEMRKEKREEEKKKKKERKNVRFQARKKNQSFFQRKKEKTHKGLSSGLART